MPLHELSDANLVERAVRRARTGGDMKTFRWVLIKKIFGTGYGYSRDLCRSYGLDPDEEV